MGSSWHGWINNEGKQRLPIQEDETALVLSALWKHYIYTTDLEYIESVYNSLIKKAANFILGFRNKQKLPNPSYDLWEMKWGIHTFTAAAVFDGLKSASKFAKILGKKEDEEMYATGAKEVREAILKYLYSDDLKYFYKYIDFEDGKKLHDETLDASSFYGIFKFGVLDVKDKRMKAAIKTFREKICCQTGIGGVSRYVGDIYYLRSEGSPGNPWIITTLWLAQYFIEAAENEKDMNEVHEWLNWVVGTAEKSGILPEQVDALTGDRLSARPLTWSHAEFVTTIISYLEKLEKLGISKVYLQVEE